jgi:hypothetical protein
MKFNPLPEDPTNADLGERIGQLHECQESYNNAAIAGLTVATKERKVLRRGQASIAREIKAIKKVATDQAADIGFVKGAIEKYERWIATAIRWRRWLVGAAAAGALAIIGSAAGAISTAILTSSAPPAEQAKINQAILDQLKDLRAAQLGRR